MYQNLAVTDDYRWLEESTPEVKAWSDAQNVVTRAHLDRVPNRAAIQQRVDQLIRSNSIAYFGLVQRKGVTFAMKSTPTLQQPQLVMLTSLDDVKTEKVLVDPNALDAKGGIAIDFFVPSLDGKKLAVSLSKGGSENGDVSVYDVATGKALPDQIIHVNNGTAGGSVAWNADATGFWYTRYPRQGEKPEADLGFFQQIYFHKLGGPADKDAYELGKELPKIAEIELATSQDGKHVLAQVKNGDGGEVAFYLRGAGPTGKWVQISTFADDVVDAAFGVDDALYLLSRKDAPKGKLLRLPLKTPVLAQAKVVVPESDGAISDFVPTAHQLYVVDLLGGPSRLRAFDLLGKSVKPLTVPEVSTVQGLTRLGDGDDVAFQVETFLQPRAWFRYDAKASALKETALKMTSAADYSDAEAVRAVAQSKDGTQVPYTMLRKKGAKLDGTTPTLIWGYGGYGVNETPRFSAVRRIWLDAGGVYVVANLRGGGEFGDAWHKAGNLTHKQNVFDDFYAVAQKLIADKVTSTPHLAIQGGSNGGLLMGAELTQHPELFRAVVSQVGIYDMLRVEDTPNGLFNVTEFGTVKDPEQFKALWAYSPLHHVKDGVAYPACLFTTGANDPRVDPWHSRKMVARLQAATNNKSLILLRTSDHAGHGIGSSMDEVIAERADIFGFLFEQLGVSYPAK
jgi:prolyl oligopeptidase